MATRTRSASGKKSSGKKSNDSAKSVSVTFEREKETLGSPKRVKVRVEVV
jgi:hypothetical protein